jgi:hypothetical protein
LEQSTWAKNLLTWDRLLLCVVSSRAHRVTPARPWRLRHFGQAKVALDLGQPAQDGKQVLAIAYRTRTPASRRWEVSV